MIRNINFSRPVHDPLRPYDPLPKICGVATPHPPGLTLLLSVYLPDMQYQSQALKRIVGSHNIA